MQKKGANKMKSVEEMKERAMLDYRQHKITEIKYYGKLARQYVQYVDFAVWEIESRSELTRFENSCGFNRCASQLVHDTPGYWITRLEMKKHKETA